MIKASSPSTKRLKEHVFKISIVRIIDEIPKKLKIGPNK